MNNSIKDQVATDLQKAKAEGNVRVERIRDIVKNAVAQAIAEIKEGSGEIRVIAKDAVFGVVDVAKEKGKEAKDEIVASIEGAIEGVSGMSRELLAQKQAQVEILQAEIQQQEQVLDSEIDGALVEIEDTGKQAPADLRSQIESTIAAIRDKQLTRLQAQYLKLKAQLADVDAQLAERHGDRYTQVKHQLDNAKDWYDSARAKAEAGEPHLIDQKQAELTTKAGEVGAAAAKAEQNIKQQVKTWLRQTADKL